MEFQYEMIEESIMIFEILSFVLTCLKIQKKVDYLDGVGTF